MCRSQIRILARPTHSFILPRTIMTISGNTPTTTFEGFLIQARSDSSKDAPLGSFVISGTPAQTLKCSASSDAVSHVNNQAKNSIKVNWMPPKDNISNIQLRATIVQTKLVFWAKVPGPKMIYNGTGTSDGVRIKASADSLLYSCVLLLLTVLLRGF
ncbi:putative defense protein 3 isoform X2 [Ambystoma mexicanum]|uniref:putative defense protein 3 isoform X2 n=1 Tax=Ambystoma mexicanum TaxID=8296 RepID=UPI0037E84B17